VVIAAPWTKQSSSRLVCTPRANVSVQQFRADAAVYVEVGRAHL